MEKDKILHTNPDDVIHPFNKKHLKELDEMTKKRGVKCENCGNPNVVLGQFSPDLGGLHFCKESCLIEFQSKNLYRACPATWIETGKEIQYGITDDNATCKGCGAKMKWIHLLSGKDMPVDPAEITVIDVEGRTLRGYIPHWGTCPKANQFKKKQ